MDWCKWGLDDQCGQWAEGLVSVLKSSLTESDVRGRITKDAVWCSEAKMESFGNGALS